MSTLSLPQTLPGIKAVGWVDCELLPPSLREHAAAGLPVGVFTAVHLLPLCADASCEVVSERSRRAVVQTATLKFRTPQMLPDDVQLGFFFTDVSNRSWLIGAAEPPYPQVKLTRKLGTPSGDPAVWEIEAKAVGERSLIPCVY